MLALIYHKSVILFFFDEPDITCKPLNRLLLLVFLELNKLSTIITLISENLNIYTEWPIVDMIYFCNRRLYQTKGSFT